MSRRVRIGVFLVSALVLAALLGWGFAGLPDFGHFAGAYGQLLNRVATGERHATNVVAAVVFDYRGVDTMGEEYILFGSVLGTLVLLRQLREEQEAEGDDETGFKIISEPSDAVRLVGLVLLGLLVMFGIYIIFAYFEGGPIALLAGLLVSIWMIRRPPGFIVAIVAAVAAVGLYRLAADIGWLSPSGGSLVVNNLALTLAVSVVAAGVCWLLMRRFAATV